MKKYKPGLLAILFTIVLMNCSTKHDHHEQAGADEWPAMDDFHMVMAETFHPYKDSFNLQPIKEKAAELETEAARWADAPLPERVNNEKVKADLAKLKTSSAELAQLVKTGTDQEIGASLIQLHDLFHHIQEAWYLKGEHGSEHGHDHH
jgi:hypothetical protein